MAAGLRGAIAFVLALKAKEDFADEHGDTILTTTILVRPDHCMAMLVRPTAIVLSGFVSSLACMCLGWCSFCSCAHCS